MKEKQRMQSISLSASWLKLVWVPHRDHNYMLDYIYCLEKHSDFASLQFSALQLGIPGTLLPVSVYFTFKRSQPVNFILSGKTSKNQCHPLYRRKQDSRAKSWYLGHIIPCSQWHPVASLFLLTAISAFLARARLGTGTAPKHRNLAGLV